MPCPPHHASSPHSPPRLTSQHALVTLPPRAPLLLVPSTQNASVRGRFRISLISTAPLASRPLHPAHSVSATGEWCRFSSAHSNAGGCRSESSWGTNPQYALWRCDLARPETRERLVRSPRLAASSRRVSFCSRTRKRLLPALSRRHREASDEGDAADRDLDEIDRDLGEIISLKLSLTRREKAWAATLRRPEQLSDAMFGLYVLLDFPDGTAGAWTQRAVLNSRLDAPGAPQLLHETCFSPSCELSCTLRLRLEPGVRLLLVPTTFGPSQFGPFHIAVHSDRAIAMEECV